MATKTIKLDIGTVYKKTSTGIYFFRYQVNGQRKAISLKTKNQEEAVETAKGLTPVVKGTTPEIILLMFNMLVALRPNRRRWNWVKRGKSIRNIQIGLGWQLFTKRSATTPPWMNLSSL